MSTVTTSSASGRITSVASWSGPPLGPVLAGHVQVVLPECDDADFKSEVGLVQYYVRANVTFRGQEVLTGLGAKTGGRVPFTFIESHISCLINCLIQSESSLLAAAAFF